MKKIIVLSILGLLILIGCQVTLNILVFERDPDYTIPTTIVFGLVYMLYISMAINSITNKMINNSKGEEK
jgi:uncharacterized membrane protein